MGQPVLFQPLTLRGVTLRNRIGVSPMCEYSSTDGYANDWHLVHLGTRAVGGAGLVMTEAAAVTPGGRISPRDLGIWSDAHIEWLARCVDFVVRQGAVAGIQLSHAGRKASVQPPWLGGAALNEAEGGWRPILAPSALPFSASSPVPQAMTLDEIQDAVAAFADAARRGLDAGFQLVELHAAHGYLLHEFLSPLSNRREDRYGGDFDNRIRLLREVVHAVRRVLPDDVPLLVRVSATDWAEGGWDVDQSVALARLLKPLGVDMLDCSSGGLLPGVRIPVEPGYQVGFAERIRRETSMPTAAVGLITEPAQAEAIVRGGRADLVLLARQLLREPYFPLRAARELGHDIAWPPQYERAKI